MSDNTPEAVTTPPNAPTLTVKYNHESRTLTAEDAARYAQMGMKYEALHPTVERLTALAASRQQTLAQYVTAAEADARQQLLAQYTDELGDPTAAAARVADESLTAETTRLEGELAELAAAGVAVTAVEQLPDAVRADARAHSRTLLDAYLRYQWQEGRAREQARADAETAAAAAVGSQSAPPPADSTDSLAHAMVRGLHSVL